MKRMDERSEKLSRFVSRMLETPGLMGLPALRKEEQALQFLRLNTVQLTPLLATLGTNPGEAARALRAACDTLLEQEIGGILAGRIALSCFPPMAGGRQPPARARQELSALVRKIAGHPVARQALSGALAAAGSDITDKYIADAWGRRKYIYVETTRVERLSLHEGEIADLERLLLLVRSAAYLSVTPGGDAAKDPENARNAAPAGCAPLPEQFVEKAVPAISVLLPSFPSAIARLALRSTLAFPAAAGLEASSRLCAIFALRGRSLGPAAVDRGADTADKSWFNVGRRNAKRRGLDPQMLDELYTIAAENGW